MWVGYGKTHDVILTVDDCSLPLLLLELGKVMRQKRETEQPCYRIRDILQSPAKALIATETQNMYAQIEKKNFEQM